MKSLKILEDENKQLIEDNENLKIALSMLANRVKLFENKFLEIVKNQNVEFLTSEDNENDFENDEKIEYISQGAINRLLTTETENKTFIAEVKEIKKIGTFKKFNKITNNQIKEIEKMKDFFPNFKDVIDFILNNLYLNIFSNNSKIYIPPILLVGSPGVGKSFFLNEISKILNTTTTERDLSVTSDSFVLSGLDKGWGNSKSGDILNTLKRSKHINPIFIFNEIDKTKTSKGSDVIFSLLPLLERQTAKLFKDEFINETINASNILFFMTSNTDKIHEAILSRVEIFKIDEPNKEQLSKIIKSIFNHINKELNNKFQELTEEQIKLFDFNLSPRIIKKIIFNSMAIASISKNKTINNEILKECIKKYIKEDKKIGFL